MNKWFYRAVGTVGIVAGGVGLLGGTAQANETPSADPQALRGLFDDLLAPTAGLDRLAPVALPVDAPGVLGSLPVTDLLPVAGLGAPAESLPGLPVLNRVGELPLVSQLGVSQLGVGDLGRDVLPLAGGLAGDLGVGPGGSVFAIDGPNDPLPAGVTDALASAQRDAGTEDLPLVGGLLGGGSGGDQAGGAALGGLPVVGGLAKGGGSDLPVLSGLPVLGGLLGGARHQAVVDDPTLTDDPDVDMDAPADFALARPAPTARAGERPIAFDIDDEYTERSYVPRHAAQEELPLVGDLGSLPLLGTARSLPLVGNLLGGL